MPYRCDSNQTQTIVCNEDFGRKRRQFKGALIFNIAMSLCNVKAQNVLFPYSLSTVVTTWHVTSRKWPQKITTTDKMSNRTQRQVPTSIYPFPLEMYPDQWFNTLKRRKKEHSKKALLLWLSSHGKSLSFGFTSPIRRPGQQRPLLPVMWISPSAQQTTHRIQCKLLPSQRNHSNNAFGSAH